MLCFGMCCSDLEDCSPWSLLQLKSLHNLFWLRVEACWWPTDPKGFCTVIFFQHGGNWIIWRRKKKKNKSCSWQRDRVNKEKLFLGELACFGSAWWNIIDREADKHQQSVYVCEFGVSVASFLLTSEQSYCCSSIFSHISQIPQHHLK